MRVPKIVLLATTSAVLVTAGCATGGGGTGATAGGEPAAPVARKYTPPPQQRATANTRPTPAPRRTAAAPGGSRVTTGTGGGSATPVTLAEGAPDIYVVKRGDTLWDISAMFLEEPWRWPEIWYINEQIENPHLIYPGDRLALAFVDGRPVLRLVRDGQAVVPAGRDTVKLSPQIRRQPLEEAITTIPYDVIGPFLTRPTVLSRSQIRRAPYLLTLQGDHLIGGEGLRAYVRGEGLERGASFSLMHVGDPYVDPDTGRVIGREALYVGSAQVVREGDPATVLLTDTTREALAGDILLPVDTDVPLYFYPSIPDERIQGSIVGVVDGVQLIGQYQVVVLNRGGDDGLQQGHVLEVFQRGEVVRDRFAGTPFNRVRLPQEFAGRVLVFRVLDEISYALVMSASSEMRVADIVRTPGEPSDAELKRERRASRGR